MLVICISAEVLCSNNDTAKGGQWVENGGRKKESKSIALCFFFVFGLAYQGNDIVFRFIIEYSSLRDFGPYVI
jgi:hypothetical protein